MITVRKMKNKNDVIVKYNILDSIKASLEGKDIVEFLIEEIKPIAKKRKWGWYFEEIKNRNNK